jgi:hypothetical protein
MTTRLSESANEGCTYVVTVSFTDEDGTPVVPTAATWTLSYTNSDDINGRTDVPITPLSTSADIVLTENDMVCRTDLNDDVVVLTVKYTYDSSLGTGLKCVDEREIAVINMVNVP